MNRARMILAFLVLTIAGGCGKRDTDGPIIISVIGSQPELVDPREQALDQPSAVLLAATAQGLVRFDGTGQIEPGLAIRWAVSDDGLFYTFRLAEGRGVDAPAVARRLRATIAKGGSRNPLKSLFGAVDEIVAVTPEVVEIRLTAPQPNLLELLAQPELALPSGDGFGAGPFMIAERKPGALVLRPVVAAVDPDGDEDERRIELQLRGERAAAAVARFAQDRASLVLGGTFDSLPIVYAARPEPRTLRFDPVSGLFGLKVTGGSAFLASPDIRRALAMAIDRDRMAASFPDANWRPSDSLVSPGTAELGAAVPPDWAAFPPALRRQIAAGTVKFWAQRNGSPPRLRVAVPEGPGAKLLFALVAADWRRIGIEAERVAPGAAADLRLMDAVAPSDSAFWYLHQFSCGNGGPCSKEADQALKAAVAARTPAERALWLGEAQGALASVVPFIPLAQPLRWSLVEPRLNGFQENGRGIHSLNHLDQRP